LRVQVLDVTLDQGGSEQNGIKLRLLGDNRSQSSRDLRYKGAYSVENGISFLGGNGTCECTAVSTSFLETRFENLLLVMDGQSTRITLGAGKGINLIQRILI
jgi:hypothetical protein